MTTRPNPLTELTLEQLHTRTSRKWRTHSPDVLPLWIAEMDVQLAAPIADALHTAINIGDTGYSHPGNLADALIGFANAQWGWAIDPAATMQMPDVMRGIVELLGLVTDPGDAVIVTTPVYPPFFTFPANAGRRVVRAPLSLDGRLDPAALERTFTIETGEGRRAALLLSNPHNPTGTVHTRSELAAVLELAARHEVRVIADEIHAPLVLPGAVFTPLLTLPGSERAFSILSASKGWNLAGLKAAIAVAGPAAITELRTLPESVAIGASHLGAIAHAAAFRHGADWLADLLAGLDANRALLADRLNDLLPELSYTPPEATFLAWLDCGVLARRGITTQPSTFFLAHARVALNPGHAFGDNGTHHVRLNFATHPDILDQALNRLQRAVRAEPAATR